MNQTTFTASSSQDPLVGVCFEWIRSVAKQVKADGPVGAAERSLKPFDAEPVGEPNPEIDTAERAVRENLEQNGVDIGLETGTAPLAAQIHPGAKREGIDRRVFLIEAGVGFSGVSIFGDVVGNAIYDLLKHLYERLNGLGFIPSVSGPSPEPATDAQGAEHDDWQAIQATLTAALLSRDIPELRRLQGTVGTTRVHRFIEMIIAHLEGRIGLAYQLLTTLDTGPPLAGGHHTGRLHLLSYAARIYSVANRPEDSLRMYDEIKRLAAFEKLKPEERVKLLRLELNHCIQTARTREDYYRPESPVLTRFDKVLAQCLEVTSSTLDAARRFHPVVGPAVICMKEDRAWIRHWHTGDTTEASAALKRQRDAIKVWCDVDQMDGPKSPSIKFMRRCGALRSDAA